MKLDSAKKIFQGAPGCKTWANVGDKWQTHHDDDGCWNHLTSKNLKADIQNIHGFKDNAGKKEYFDSDKLKTEEVKDSLLNTEIHTVEH